MIKKILIGYILISLGCVTPPKRTVDFTLTDIEGKRWTLSEQKSIVLINFWATWCPPCKKEIPILVRIYNKYKDKGFLILGIAFDKKELVKSFVKKYKINYPVLIGDYRVAQDYEITTIPQTYLINKEGKIVKRWFGLAPNFETELEAYIDSLLLWYK